MALYPHCQKEFNAILFEVLKHCYLGDETPHLLKTVSQAQEKMKRFLAPLVNTHAFEASLTPQRSVVNFNAAKFQKRIETEPDKVNKKSGVKRGRRCGKAQQAPPLKRTVSHLEKSDEIGLNAWVFNELGESIRKATITDDFIRSCNYTLEMIDLSTRQDACKIIMEEIGGCSTGLINKLGGGGGFGLVEASGGI